MLDHEPPTAEELALEGEVLVPFPHELNKELGLELIHVFAAEVVVTTTVGSGELFKAALQKHKYGWHLQNDGTQEASYAGAEELRQDDEPRPTPRPLD